jgi:hypothetical protein
MMPARCVTEKSCELLQERARIVNGFAGGRLSAMKIEPQRVLAEQDLEVSSPNGARSS